MSQARISYFSLQGLQGKEAKLDWIAGTSFEKIQFENINPDGKGNWINLTDNDFDSFLPLVDKKTKSHSSEESIFKVFSSGVQTKRDEWAYSFSKSKLVEKMKYFIKTYQEYLMSGVETNLGVKWDHDLKRYLERKIAKSFQDNQIFSSLYRPYTKKFLYFDKHFNGRTFQLFNIFPSREHENLLIFCTDVGTQSPFMVTATNCIPDLHLVGTAAQCLPLYRYDAKGDRVDNITDWGLTQFQTHYKDPQITKENIFHYTYAVLHHPAYRTKYELNLKREFPRIPFYDNFQQWADWGKQLMDLHINFEDAEPYELERIGVGIIDEAHVAMQASLFKVESNGKDASPTKKAAPKCKLKADKVAGTIELDTVTTLKGIPAIAWEYKLGLLLDCYSSRRGD